MKKGIVLGLVLLLCMAGGLFAQQAQDANSKTWWVSGELGFIHGGARGEYMLTDNFSVGVDFFMSSAFLMIMTNGYEVFGRWYPWGTAFYAELGLGYGEITLAGEGTQRGFLLDPGIGWKADVGVPGAFYLNPMIQMPYILGFGPSFKIALGLGYAF